MGNPVKKDINEKNALMEKIVQWSVRMNMITWTQGPQLAAETAVKQKIYNWAQKFMHYDLNTQAFNVVPAPVTYATVIKALSRID